jgi:hypothetical protein
MIFLLLEIPLADEATSGNLPPQSGPGRLPLLKRTFPL